MGGEYSYPYPKTYPDLQTRLFAPGDGVSDAHWAIAAADGIGPFYFEAGTYLLSDDLTISNNVHFNLGAKISVASGKTVTFNGKVTADGDGPLFSGSGSVYVAQGEVRATWFGAVYDNSTDSTAALDKAAQSLLNGGVVLHSAGTVCATALVMYNKVQHRGVSQQATTIRALASANGSFITLNTGPVTYAWFENLTISGGSVKGTATNSGQWAATLTAVADGSSTGGLWYSNWDNVRIWNFDNGINLVAGDNFSLPHQQSTWTGVEVIRNNATGKCLRMQNQCEQFQFNGCLWDAVSGTVTGTNIEFVAGTNTRPSIIRCIRNTIQNTNQAILASGCFDVSIDGWFENIKQCCTFSGDNRDFSVGGRFVNAANSSGSGYLFSGTGTGNIRMLRSTLGGTTDKIVNSLASTLYISYDEINNSSSATAGSLNSTKQISESSGVLTCGMARTFFVNTSATTITTINSDLLPGNSIFLKAHGGTIVLGTGGNINLGTASSPLTITSGKMIELIRLDLGGTWYLVGT